MIAKAAQRMIEERESKFLIPSEIVANVQEDNHLDHAFLVLTKVKYAKIPVLDILEIYQDNQRLGRS